MNRYAGFKLLIVDDHAHNLFTLRTLIEAHMDVAVLEATSGQQAIDLTQHHPDIDLIILDVQMPEMDGFQTASLLKLRKRTRDIPIIFLTAAFKSEEFQQRGFAVGAVDYLLKPIDDNLLINKISTYFRLIEKERGAQPGAGAAGRRAHRGAGRRPGSIWRTSSPTWARRCWSWSPSGAIKLTNPGRLPDARLCRERT